MSDPACLKYEELCAEYDLVINERIVLASPSDRTIFDISEYPHYEEVISNWYAFFFDPSAEHSLRDLFLQSLIEFITEKHNSDFSMQNCHVERELQTNKGNFIDLVLYEQAEEDEIFESAIIIENKIYAGIYNDLDDYYDSVKTEPGQKVGIVLSLHEIEKLPESFINITHEKLLEVIQRNLGEYVVSAKLKYIHTLQDFISNLKQMTRLEDMQDHIKYYFDNATKIDDLVDLKAQAKNYLKENLRHAVAGSSYEWKREAEGAFRFAYSNGRILFYLYTIEKILREKKFVLSVWLNGEKVVKHWKRVGGSDKISSEKYQQEYQLKLFPHEPSDEWVSLADKEYEITNIENFGEEVFEFLIEDWSKFLEDVTDILK